MATATKVTKTVRRVVEVSAEEDDGVELKLTTNEAEALHQLLHVGYSGSHATSAARYVGSIYVALGDAGVRPSAHPYNKDGGHVHFEGFAPGHTPDPEIG